MAADTKDHSLVDRLIGFIVRIAALVALAVAAAPLGAMAVGDDVVNEMVKAGVIALVALALQSVADLVLAKRAERRPAPAGLTDVRRRSRSRSTRR